MLTTVSENNFFYSYCLRCDAGYAHVDRISTRDRIFVLHGLGDRKL